MISIAKLQSPQSIHKIIRDASVAVEKARKDNPTALREIGDSTNGDPFRILIATVLSHRTKDPTTAAASSRLFAKYPGAQDLKSANTRTIAKLIKPVGFYKTKAKTVKRLAKIILDDYDGKVPEDVDELLKLPSVGRKTANCVLVYGFGKPAIPVDTHVHRIFNRIGIVSTGSPVETEEELVRLVDRKDWIELNDVFVKFGQTVCRPIGPRCPTCSLTDRCRYYQQVYSKKFA
jgi:endonuclease III